MSYDRPRSSSRTPLNYLFRIVFGSKYKPALSLNGNFVTVNECTFIERVGVNSTKYLQIDRLFLLRDFNPDFELAEISIYITARVHIHFEEKLDKQPSKYLDTLHCNVMFSGH